MQKIENSSAVIYNDGEIELDVSVKQDTLWLTQKQLGLLFDVEVHTVIKKLETLKRSGY